MRRAYRSLGPFAAPGLMLALGFARRADAGDPFEIQVYDGTANAPGVFGLELHLNDWATGHRDSTPPVAPLNGQFHATLEPSFGLTPFWELGAYLQSAVRTDDGVVDWAGAKLRSKFVTPPTWDLHWRLGLNLELGFLPRAYDASRWGLEVRPIVSWHDPDWLLSLNPILDQSLGTIGASGGPSFQPAFKVARTVGPVALGLEYYATIDRVLTGAVAPRSQEHYLFEVVDVLSLPRWELNLGVGEGLTPSSEGLILKAILGYEFESVAAEGPRASE